MDNSYAVLNSSLKYKSDKVDLAGGVYLADFDGDHFGRVIWDSVDKDIDHEWYRYNGRKKEATSFARAEYRAASWLTAYAELQYRLLWLDMGGIDDEFSDLSFQRNWGFFNPRAGLTGKWGPHKAYTSFAIGHREPGKSDLKEQIESANALIAAGQKGEVTLRPERMYDTELGYEFAGTAFSGGVNLYSMEYRDMLLETGKLSDSGYAIKENIDRSWRRGVELSAAWKPAEWVTVNGNLTLSTNKIKDYTYYEDTNDDAVNWTFVGKTRVDCGTVTMLMSPSCTGMAGLEFKPLAGHDLVLGLTAKYVGRQYWDNTQNDDLCIPAYYVVDCRAEYGMPLWKGRMTIGVYCNNLLNRDYYADAWVYRALFADGSPEYIEEGLFPQALRNYSIKLALAF